MRYSRSTKVPPTFEPVYRSMNRYVLLPFVLMYMHAAVAQPNGLERTAPTVVVLTAGEASEALQHLASLMVQDGYMLAFDELTETQFSTQPRTLIVDSDLEFLVEAKHTVQVIVDGALTTLYVVTHWDYAERNTNKPMTNSPLVQYVYKKRYDGIYGQRIQAYIEQVVRSYEDVLLTYPLEIDTLYD